MHLTIDGISRRGYLKILHMLRQWYLYRRNAAGIAYEETKLALSGRNSLLAKSGNVRLQ